MFHLLVSGNDEAFKGEPRTIDADRCHRAGYTHESLAVDFSKISAEQLRRLEKLPCLFAYENCNKMDARLGYITKIRHIGAKVQVRYRFLEGYPPIKPEDLLTHRWELGIGELEMNRTHWALKDEDLSAALESMGYPPIQSRNRINIHEHDFDVALSFPGELRPYVKSVADLLLAQLGDDRIFYDNAYKAQLARPNLDTALQSIYTRSRLIVVFLSANYASKKWCSIEFRAIREIINARADDRVMLVRRDSASVEGIFTTDGFIDAETHSPEELVGMIIERVSLLPAPVP